MTDTELIKEAGLAYAQAYAPYSNFRVGAALLTSDGKLYCGCNIENASYGATMCAERTAIFKAVSEGATKIEKIAVVCEAGTPAYPCGMCLQVLSEWMDPKGTVLLTDCDEVLSFRLEDLLPHAFTSSAMET